MTLKRKGNDKQENTLYLQMRKDLRKQNKRVYIPVAVFQHPENIEIKSSKKLVAKQKMAAIFGPVIR